MANIGLEILIEAGLPAKLFHLILRNSKIFLGVLPARSCVHCSAIKYLNTLGCTERSELKSNSYHRILANAVQHLCLLLPQNKLVTLFTRPPKR